MMDFYFNVMLKMSLIFHDYDIAICVLTLLPLVPHIYASVNRVRIGSDNGLSPIRRQTIIKTNAGLLSIESLKTNFS